MFEKHRYLLIVAAILCFITTAVICLNPGAGLVSVSLFIGISVLFSGIAEIFEYIRVKKSGWLLAYGIFSVIVSIWFLSGSFLDLASAVPFIVAFWIIYASVTKIVDGYHASKDFEDKSGNVLIVLGILGIIIGLIMLYAPVISAAFVIYFIAGVFLYEGILCIVQLFRRK